jgi:hypothetical protein
MQSETDGLVATKVEKSLRGEAPTPVLALDPAADAFLD